MLIEEQRLALEKEHKDQEDELAAKIAAAASEGDKAALNKEMEEMKAQHAQEAKAQENDTEEFVSGLFC